jgi:hypothetical protein
MRALALDPATITGFAFGIFGERPRSGTIRLPTVDPDDVGHRFSVLEGAVRDQISGNKAEKLIIEDIYLNPMNKFSPRQDFLLKGYRAAIIMAAHKCGLHGKRDCVWVYPGSWRKTFGTSHVPKEVRDSKKSDAIRKYLKTAAFERCRELGWDPRNEDESDALGLWSHGETLFSQGDSNERMPLFAATPL